MKKFLFLSTLVLAVTSSLVADPVVNVTDDGLARATSSADFVLNGNQGTVTLSSDVTSYGWKGGSGDVQSITTLMQDLTTAGADRQGLVKLSMSGSNSSLDGSASTYAALPNSLEGYDLSASCVGNSPCTSKESFFRHYEFFAFELGHQFELNASARASMSYTPLMGGDGSSDLVYTFSFFEADGLTPVALMTATPEPATWSSIGLSLSAVALIRKRRQA